MTRWAALVVAGWALGAGWAWALGRAAAVGDRPAGRVCPGLPPTTICHKQACVHTIDQRFGADR